MTIRLTKEFSFEMAHLLEGYDGQCCNIHGHSYRLFVTISGAPNSNPDSPKYGMVMDFIELKRIVKAHIVDKLEHTLMLRKGSKMGETLKATQTKIVSVDYQPTCENIVAHMAEILSCELPKNVRLHSIKLYETAASFAEWYADDNK